ncbi:ATP-binding protein [Deltaproteobacteria bacterium TL4]
MSEESKVTDNESLETLKAENKKLREQVQLQQTEMNSQLRLLTAGESVAMIVHEVLNPITSVISRLQNLLDEEGEFQLFHLIIGEWMNEYQEEGIETLYQSLGENVENENVIVLEEDLKNLHKASEVTLKGLEFIHLHLKRAVMIINNLRELSRVESTIEPIDVKHSIHMVKELMEHSLQKRNVTIEYECHHTSTIQIDENELVQVLHNLARNAMQAINKDGMIVFKTSETPERLEIRISDTGPGIPEEIAGKIFESRFTTKGKREGTGLGLTFSRRMLKKYNGGLELESLGGKGRGAVFLCWLQKSAEA